MELSLSEKHRSIQEILQRLQSCKSYFLDPHMKALASSLGKNVYDTTRWCKALKLRMATNASWEQREAPEQQQREDMYKMMVNRLTFRDRFATQRRERFRSRFLWPVEPE